MAAVAAILRERAGELELLFIRRAKRRGDPWSGHMAWPGGKREAGDSTLLACAVRETREEIGLDLERDAEWVGTVRGWRHEGAAPRRLHAIFPFVFVLPGDGSDGGRPPMLRRQGDEVQEIVWIPLSYFTTWRSRAPWKWVARWLPRVPPAFRYEGRLVWGLTQWMLTDLLGRLDRGYTAIRLR